MIIGLHGQNARGVAVCRCWKVKGVPMVRCEGCLGAAKSEVQPLSTIIDRQSCLTRGGPTSHLRKQGKGVRSSSSANCVSSAGTRGYEPPHAPTGNPGAPVPCPPVHPSPNPATPDFTFVLVHPELSALFRGMNLCCTVLIVYLNLLIHSTCYDNFFFF